MCRCYKKKQKTSLSEIDEIADRRDKESAYLQTTNVDSSKDRRENEKENASPKKVLEVYIYVYTHDYTCIHMTIFYTGFDTTVIHCKIKVQ